MVVRIDETRQYSIAVEVDYRVARMGIGTQGGDARTHDSHAGDVRRRSIER